MYESPWRSHSSSRLNLRLEYSHVAQSFHGPCCMDLPLVYPSKFEPELCASKDLEAALL